MLIYCRNVEMILIENTKISIDGMHLEMLNTSSYAFLSDIGNEQMISAFTSTSMPK